MRSTALLPQATSSPIASERPEGASLAGLAPGSAAWVWRLDPAADAAVAERLMEMGLVPGIAVCRLRAGSVRGPLVVRLRGYLLSLGQQEAACVQVVAQPPPV